MTRLRGPSALFPLLLAVAGCGTPAPESMDAAVESDAGRDAPPPDAWRPDVFLPDDPGPARAIFVLDPAMQTGFFDLPWPTDLRTDAMGHLDLTGFDNPRSALVDRYLEAIQARQVGFATNGAVYFRFSRRVDEATLPADLAASIDDRASVFLVDVDPDSPSLGVHLPIVLHYQQLSTLYWPDRTLALRTVDGVPLAGGRTYAAVVTSRVHATDGTPFERDADFQALVDGSAPAETIARYQPALDALAPVLDDVISLAVFTTQDPTALGFQLRDYVHDQMPAPTVTAAGLTRGVQHDTFNVLEGHYGPVPIFQSGVVPYVTEGGDIDLDDGTVVEGTFDARFALAIPKTPMPPGGYPIVLYSHGTGGDYHSFIQDHTAERLAAIGIASMGIDQIAHGERDPTHGSPEILFFNINNPDAVRYNTLESAVDIVSQARYAASIDVPTTVLDRDGAQIHFDPTHVYFFGHSQGGLVAPLYLAMDDGTRGGVISEGGGLIGYALTLKVEPISIPDVVRSALGIRGTLADEAFDNFHPVITLIQGWIEPSEPTNWAGYLFDHPRPGFAPKSIFMTEGGIDPYTPPPSIEALAVGMRIPQVDPIWRPIPTLSFLGIDAAGTMAHGNVAGGGATAALLQFPTQGHFAVFDDAECQRRYAGFFQSLVTDGMPGTIPQ
ncbi:MAG: hypothetical protein U0234_02085 [Sandaracinus sp.]